MPTSAVCVQWTGADQIWSGVDRAFKSWGAAPLQGPKGGGGGGLSPQGFQGAVEPWIRLDFDSAIYD